MSQRRLPVAVLFLVLALVCAVPAPSSATEAPSSDGDTAIPNRYLAFGDSITHGGYADQDYPSRLEGILDLRVADSEVINAGNPGEKTFGGSERITGAVSDHQPQYVLIMEGTNDVTEGKPPSEVYDNLLNMIDHARVTAGVADVRVMLATLVPRLDYLNDATEEMNEQAIIPAAQARNVPICDQWTAFVSLSHWPYLYRDDKHPNDAGLELMANTFYDCLLASFPDLEEETTPPTVWIEWLPGSVECGDPVQVGWNGEDNLNWVVDYDVQARIGDSGWTDWLSATEQTTGVHPGGGRYGDSIGFRARGRDLLGNESAYSEPAYTPIADSVPPYEIHVAPLRPIALAPVAVSWWGSDACADVTTYDVQYRIDTTGSWQGWLTATHETGAGFDPPAPQYGATYSFRARAQDAAGNWSTWSEDEAHTVLARMVLAGHVYNVRHGPVAAAQVEITPAPLGVRSQPAGFFAYLAQGGAYDVSAARDDAYGMLPTMWDVPVYDDVSDLQLVLPPQDDAVTDAGFEAGNLDAWQLGGSRPPALSGEAHTGLGAVALGADGEDSLLRQAIQPPPDPVDPTLSFAVRLATGSPASVLQIALENASGQPPLVTHTVAVDSQAWTYAWFDVSGWVDEPLTLTLTVSDQPAILVDEISLGSSVEGGYLSHLPVTLKADTAHLP